MPQSTSHVRPQHSDSARATGAPRLLAVVVILTAVFAMGRGLFAATSPSATATPDVEAPVASRSPSTVPSAAEPESATTAAAALPPTSTPTPAGPLPVGIVAGHWGSDSGAVCDGDLHEVDVNLDIAERVVYTLRATGYEVDFLEEYDDRMEGYRARALISIHADSCLYPEASGFKVARVADSAVPNLEDELVTCLVEEYGALTGLAFHEGSITPDMLYYHSFYEIDPFTPGAIIEVGFMLADRDILLNRSDIVAQGIVNGIICFLAQK